MDQIDLQCAEASRYLLPYLSKELDGKPEAEQFEAHVRDCPICKSLVKDKRRALQAVLAALGAQETDSQNVDAPVAKFALQPRQKRTLVVSAVIGTVLLAMCWLLRPGSDLIGEKIGASLKVDQAAVSAPVKTETVTKTDAIKTAEPVPADPKPVKTAAPSKPEPAKQKAEKPISPTQPKISTHKTHKRRSSARSREPLNRVTVFDENGSKVGETVQSGGKP